MAEINQFGSKQPSRSPDPDHCAQCETMLADALDRTLSLEDQAIFDRHLSVCPDCSRMFIDAKLGADLLSKLHDTRPVPSDALLERILIATGPLAEVPAVQPNTLLGQPVFQTTASAPVSYGTAKVIPFRQRLRNAFRPQALAQTLMQPRLAMTAAMAFFSIALTLNLTGVRITQLRVSDFTPSSIKRSFYDTNARVVRSIDNLRVVYELESRVRDLQRDSDASAPVNSSPAPSENAPSEDKNQNNQRQKDPQKPSPRQRSGSSRTLRPEPSRQFTASLAEFHSFSRTGSSPRPGHEPKQAFVIFTPTIFNAIEQGGQA